jgi:hypothetical protein
MGTASLVALFATVGVGAEWGWPSPVIKNVQVTVAVKGDVEIAKVPGPPPDMRYVRPNPPPGGRIATVPVTITVKNTGLGPMPFSRRYLVQPAVQFVPNSTGKPRAHWVGQSGEPAEGDQRVVWIDPGQTYTTTERYNFYESSGQPRTGDTFTVKVRLYGRELSTPVTFR